MQGVGKVVSYTNADRILPHELLDAIQQHADGVYLYIFRAKAERKRAGGEGTDSAGAARNRSCTRKHLGGAPRHKLATYLSKTIYKNPCLHAAGMTDSATGPRLRRFV